MRTTDYAKGIVFGLLASVNKPKYLTTKPDSKIHQEYIVINSLPINADVMQKCIINVNYHVKDIEPGMEDTIRLEAGSQVVLDILEHVTFSENGITKYMIDFESQETIPELSLDEHFSNLRFSFKLINN